MSKKLFLSLVLCLSLLGTASPTLAQVDRTSGEDTLVKLQREGWKIINEGVLQRELRPGKIESFVFGVPGFTWQIQDLRRQLKELQDEFRAHPTPELRKAIASHRKVIANAQRTLEVARTYEALGESGVLKESCITNSSSAHAAVGSKEDVQGVWAEASAAYSGDCEAQIYAYAFSKAGINGEDGPGTMRFDGPRSAAGGPTDLLYVESNGGAPCNARAYSYVFLGIYPPIAESQEETFECPSPLDVAVTADAPSATIDLYNNDCITINWTANISGGASPYSSTMYLNGASQGAGPTYSGTWCNVGTNSSRTLDVSATVTDSSDPARSKSGSAPTITVRSHPVTPLAVTVTSDAPSTTIDLYNNDCITITWTANISGGTSPYSSTMYLGTTSQGAGPTYSGTWCNVGTSSSNTIKVAAIVNDSSNPVQSKTVLAQSITIRSHQVTLPLTVTVTSNAPSTTIDLYNSDCITIDWTTNISGGASPYTSTMYLNGTALEAPRRETSRTSYSNRYCNAGTNTSLIATVSATVTDSSNPVQSRSASAPAITIRSHIKPLAVTVASNAPSTIVDLYNSDCITITWSTNISGGTSPYSSTMYLNNVSQGVRTTYSKSYCNAKTNSSLTASARATVTDSGNPVQSQSASAPTITIRSHVVVVSPLNVTVTSNAPSTLINLYADDCVTITWTTSISGGTPSYTSTMSSGTTSLGVRTTYSATYCNARTNTSRTVTISATVTDSGSPVQTKSASAPTITIQSHYYPEPTCYLVAPGGKAVAPIPICP